MQDQNQEQDHLGREMGITKRNVLQFDNLSGVYPAVHAVGYYYENVEYICIQKIDFAIKIVEKIIKNVIVK